jgi:Amt family ammonium transporter
VGAIAGCIIPVSVVAFDRVKLDDPVGATSVHLVCGIFGTLAVGIFSSIASPHQLLIQLTGVLAIGGFTFVFAYSVMYLLKATVGIRVSEEEETRGLDVSEHEMEAYQEFEGAKYELAVH